jgi:hypothetical protein
VLVLVGTMVAMVMFMGDLILIDAILIEFCISIKIHLILIEMMKMLFDPIKLYSNRSAKIPSF